MLIRAPIVRIVDHGETTTVLGPRGARMFSGDSAALVRAVLEIHTRATTEALLIDLADRASGEVPTNVVDDVVARKVRVPVALAFVLTACGGDDEQPCHMTKEPCVQAPNTTEVCPENVCVDSSGGCPTGCIAAGEKRYCVPDGTDAGVCPQPSICIIASEACPAGCTPVG